MGNIVAGVMKSVTKGPAAERVAIAGTAGSRVSTQADEAQEFSGGRRTAGASRFPCPNATP